MASGEVIQLGISIELLRHPYVQETVRRIRPRVLQNRFYAESGFGAELREFCAENGVT